MEPEIDPRAVRREDLGTHITEALRLMAEYETKLRLSGEPREKEQCRKAIEELRRSLDEYQTEYNALLA